MHFHPNLSLFEFFSQALMVAKDGPPSYEDEKSLSEEIDLRLGIRFENPRETRLEDGAETWGHLSPQVFQTPYPELYRMIEEVDPTKTVKIWVDLGAAYGRLGLLLGAFRPSAEFVGIEIDESRVLEAKRIYAENNIAEASMQQGDCERDPLPIGDVYLIYDFGHRRAVESALEKLRTIATSRPLLVIGRGRRVRDLIEQNHPWLGSVFDPVHHAHYSIYRTYTEECPEE